MTSYKYVTSTRKTKTTQGLVTVILIYHSFITRMKSLGSIALIDIRKNKKIIDHHIECVKEAFENVEIIISSGYEAQKIQSYVSVKYKHMNIRCVENTNYEDTGLCESLRIAVNNTSNDNILVINGGVYFDKNSLKQMPLKQCETMVSRSSGTNLDIGVNVDGKNMSIEYICYGAIDCKWCEIFYIHNGSPANEFRKLVTSNDYKNKVLYEIVNTLVAHKKISIKPVEDNKAVKKINLTKGQDNK